MTTAVLDHELGHIRYKHIWLYLLFMAMSLALVSIFTPELTKLVFIYYKGLSYSSLQLAITIVLMLIALRIGFGLISRACVNWHKPILLVLSKPVAMFRPCNKPCCKLHDSAGNHRMHPAQMHGSIEQRVAFLERCKADPGLITNHHPKEVYRNLRFLIILLLGLAILMSFPDQQRVTQPTKWIEKDIDRKEAFDAALAGDPKPLHRYLSRIDTGDGTIMNPGSELRIQFAKLARVAASMARLHCRWLRCIKKKRSTYLLLL